MTPELFIAFMLGMVVGGLAVAIGYMWAGHDR